MAARIEAANSFLDPFGSSGCWGRNSPLTPFTRGNISVTLGKSAYYGAFATEVREVKGMHSSLSGDTPTGAVSGPEGSIRFLQPRSGVETTEETAETGKFSWDCAGNSLEWSGSIARILGVAPEDCESTWPWFVSRLHREDQPRVTETLRRAAANGQSYVIEFRIIRPDGSPRDIRAVGRAERAHDEARSPRVVGTLHDVTGERTRRHALRRSRNLAAAVLDSATEQAIIATDADGVVLIFNTGAERMLGFTADQMVGHTTYRLHEPGELGPVGKHPGGSVHFSKFLDRMAEGPRARPFTFVTRSGERRKVLLTVTAMPRVGGRASGYVQVATDITDQLLAQAVIDSETRFRNIFQSAPNGMMLIDLEASRSGRMTQVNPAMCTLTGYSIDQLLRKDITDLTVAEHRSELCGRLEEFRLGRRTSLATEQLWVDAQGAEVWVQFNMSPKASPRDEYLVAQAENITARKATEARLTQQALHDNLTGLPNRLLLMDRITHALAARRRSRRGVGVFYLDLDGFKMVNDTAGHGAGDQTLQQVAGRLRQSLRPGDTVARLGGDEFVAVCLQIDTVDAAKAVGERIVAVLAAPYRIGSNSFSLSASVGVSVSTNDSSPDQLLHDADQAMYSAKAAGRGRVCVGRANVSEKVFHSAEPPASQRVQAEAASVKDNRA